MFDKEYTSLTNFKAIDSLEKGEINSSISSLKLFSKIFLSRKMNLSLQALANYFSLMKKAIASFLQASLTDFDALVGENSCQIRAYILIDIFERLNDDTAKLFLRKINSSLDGFINYLSKITLSPKEEALSVQQFLEKHTLYFFVPSTYFNDLNFLFDAYILTLCKLKLNVETIYLAENINYVPLIELGFIAKKAKKIIKGMQQSLSSLSCFYIQNDAHNLKNDIFEELLQAKLDNFGRPCLPHFYSAKIILNLLLSKKRTLILKISRYWQQSYIDSLTLFYCANKEGNDFRLISESTDKNAYVLEGLVIYSEYPEAIASYTARLAAFPLYDLLLANFACHPQYAGNKKHEPIPFATIRDTLEKKLSDGSFFDENQSIKNKLEQLNKEERDFNEKKALGIKAGCCIESPKLLFLKHIYSDRMINHVILPRRTVVLEH